MLRDPSLIPLSRQHQHGLALCVMTERALRQENSAKNVAKLARKAIDHYDLELTNHFEIEERILFPALAAHGLVKELIAQHRQLEALVARLREEPSAALLLEFMALLRAHIRREENELFEDAPKIITREKLEEIGREIDASIVRICL